MTARVEFARAVLVGIDRDALDARWRNEFRHQASRYGRPARYAGHFRYSQSSLDTFGYREGIRCREKPNGRTLQRAIARVLAQLLRRLDWGLVSILDRKSVV